MTAVNHFLCTSGLETDPSYDTFWYHTSKCTVDIGSDAVVPMHFKYDYEKNVPKQTDLRYDYIMFSEQLRDTKQVDANSHVLLFQMGTQMITFTYQTPLKIQHYIFPLSSDVEKFFWFVHGDMLRTGIITYLKLFMDTVARDLEADRREYEHHGTKMPNKVFVVSTFRDEDEVQIVYKTIVEEAIKDVFAKSKQLEVQPTIQYQRYQKNSKFTKDDKVPVYVTWYRGKAFNQAFQVQDIEKFEHIVQYYEDENTNEINTDFSTSTGLIHLQAVIPREVKFPISYQVNHEMKGLVRWLIFGDILSFAGEQERMYLGVGWFPGAGDAMPHFFPIRLDPDEVGCV